MKRTLFLIGFCLGINFAISSQNSVLPRLAIVEFSTNNQSEKLKEVSKAVRDLIESHMAGMRQFTIVTYMV